MLPRSDPSGHLDIDFSFLIPTLLKTIKKEALKFGLFEKKVELNFFGTPN